MSIRVLMGVVVAGLALMGCQGDFLDPAGLPDDATALFARGGGGGGGHETTAGNNLSFPVIWAEGVTKALQGSPDVDPALGGEWWWWWETDATEEEYTACAPNPMNPDVCQDGTAPGGEARRAWVQKDAANTWQAGTYAPAGHVVNVDRVDWGDDLEAKSWTTRSMVRIETVLFQDLTAAPYSPMTEYVMRHVSGWGSDEVWGLSTFQGGVETGTGTQATVFTPCARLTIQRLLTDRDDPALGLYLDWDAGAGLWRDPEGSELDLVDEAAFLNMAVHEAADGPGYYNAEVNVKGMIIFGYTLNARRAGLDAGDYRVTFSLDGTCGTVSLNTHFTDLTQIVQPEEEAAAILAAEDEGPDTGSGQAVISVADNLTYIDIRLTASGGGGGGGGGGSGGGGGGGGPRH